MPGEAKKIKLGHNSILTKHMQTPPKFNLYEKEKQFLVERESWRNGLFEIHWKLELLFRMHMAFSSCDLWVTYSQVCALCTAQMSFCGTALPLVGRAIIFFSTDSSYPFHNRWQRTIFFFSYIFCRGTWNEGRLNFNSSRINFTPKGGVMLKKHPWPFTSQVRSEVILNVQYPGLKR